jgi:hypothetical protein
LKLIATSFLIPFYYTALADRRKLVRWLRYESTRSRRSTPLILVDATWCAARYGVTLEEYLLYRFSDKPARSRREYAGARWGWRFVRQVNAELPSRIVRNKKLFNEHFAHLVRRPWLSVDDLGRGFEAERLIWSSPSQLAVIKNSSGHGGKDVRVVSLQNATPESVRSEMLREGYDLLEGYVVQHRALDALFPGAVNTVRIVTYLRPSGPEILMARLRVSLGAPVDNASAGGGVVRVSIDTGTLEGNAFTFDVTHSELMTHPTTGVTFDGYQIPFWPEVRETVLSAAGSLRDAKSIAWDVAITPEGPELIEGNIKYGRRVWQVPTGRGLLPEIRSIEASLDRD